MDNNVDYVTSIAVDDIGNIYVTGASYSTADSSLDYTILKLDLWGSEIWVEHYSGEGNEDVPVAIQLDDAGNIYVTGVSEGDSTGKDFSTLKFDDSGTLQWSVRYNFLNLDDVAVGLEVDPDGEQIWVTGASASNTTSWDFLTLEYNSSGTLVSSYRQPSGIGGYDSPVSISQDSFGNILITGSALKSLTSYDFQTIKLDSNFTVKWTKYIDYAGYQDGSNDVKTDSNGNVYVTGYAQNADLGFGIMTVKYDSAGTELWRETRWGDETTDTVIAKYMTIDEEGIIYVTGDIQVDGVSSFITIMYDSEGEFISEQIYTDPNEEGITTDMRVDLFGNIYITGMSSDSNSTHYTTIKYSKLTLPSDIVFDSLGTPLYNKYELFVRFDSAAIKKSAVDNLDIQFASPDYFLKSVALEDFNEKASDGEYIFFRLFPHLKTTDTLTKSRLNEDVRIPAFWATFGVIVPEQVDIFELNQSLDSLFPTVRYAHPCYWGSLSLGASNDFWASEQYSLGDIYMNQAWCIEGGRSFVKCGVYDTGIDWRHEDFGSDGVNFSTSKVKDGWDYEFGMSIAQLVNPSRADRVGHGTKTAGVIGALRNNSKGIAGIAGGEVGIPYLDGVSLYSLKISSPGFFDFDTIQGPVSLRYIADAIVGGGNNG